MASIGFVAMIAILVLGLVLPNFQVLGQFNPERAMKQAKAVATGNGGPGVEALMSWTMVAKTDERLLASINFIRAFKAACNHHPGRQGGILREIRSRVDIISGPCSCEAPLMVQ
ncbi:hypothetical protein GQ457_13G000080 [Hibiscus cannabinus]